MRYAAFVLLAADAFGQDERVTVDFSNESAAKICEVFGTYMRHKLVLDPLYEDATITIKLSNAPADKAYAAVAKELDAEAWQAPDKTWHIGPKWSIALREKMATTELAAVVGMPNRLNFYLIALRGMSKMNLVADPELDLTAKVSTVMDTKTLDDVLDQICEKAGCAWDLRWGVVYIADKKRLAALPRTLRVKETGKSVDLPFKSTPIAEAAKYLARAGNLELKLDPGVKEETEISMEAKGIDFAHALELALLPHGHTATIDGKTLIVKAR